MSVMRGERTLSECIATSQFDPNRTLDLFQILSGLTRWRSISGRSGVRTVMMLCGEVRSVRCQCRANRPFLPCNLGLVAAFFPRTL